MLKLLHIKVFCTHSKKGNNYNTNRKISIYSIVRQPIYYTFIYIYKIHSHNINNMRDKTREATEVMPLMLNQHVTLHQLQVLYLLDRRLTKGRAG